jgi:hypothetical protein
VAGDAIGVTLAAQQRNGVLSQHGELSDRLVVPEPEMTVTASSACTVCHALRR